METYRVCWISLFHVYWELDSALGSVADMGCHLAPMMDILCRYTVWLYLPSLRVKKSMRRRQCGGCDEGLTTSPCLLAPRPEHTSMCM